MTLDHVPAQQASTTRILIANLSGVMSEVVLRALEQQPDMTISRYMKDLVELPEAIGHQIDVLILGAAYLYPPPTICRDLWHSFPALKVLVLTPSGDAAVMYWLSARQKRLKTVSASTLIDSIRQVQRRDLTDG